MGWLHRTLARLRAWWRAAINRLFAGRITVDAAQLSRQQAEIARAIGESTLRVRELEASIRACRAACDAHEIQAIERIQEGDEQGATEALLRAERERERLEQLQVEREHQLRLVATLAQQRALLVARSKDRRAS